MGITWRDFQFPKKISIEEETYTSSYGKFIAEPLERGYGVTLGNSLQRVLLSSIEGAADGFEGALPKKKPSGRAFTLHQKAC